MVALPPVPCVPFVWTFPLPPSPRASSRPVASIVMSPLTRMIAALTPVKRTVTPLRMRNVRYSNTTALEPSVEFLHVLRDAPVEMFTSAGGSKSSGLALFACEPAEVQPPGPFEVSGPESA